MYPLVHKYDQFGKKMDVPFSYDALRGVTLQTPYKDISHNFQITPMSDGKNVLSKTLILKNEVAETKASSIVQFMRHESAKLVSG